jgi:hypothetical protein
VLQGLVAEAVDVARAGFGFEQRVIDGAAIAALL